MRGVGETVGLAFAALAAAALIVGCAPPPADEAPPVLETEDIGPGSEEELDLSTDRRGARRSATSGQLPGGFPEGLPIYQPSTISDVGQGEDRGFVQFMSQHDAEAIRGWYPSALASAGWSVESAPDGALLVRRGQRSARLTIESSGAVAVIRVEY